MTSCRKMGAAATSIGAAGRSAILPQRLGSVIDAQEEREVDGEAAALRLSGEEDCCCGAQKRYRAPNKDRMPFR
jgi:hypothetical protein